MREKRRVLILLVCLLAILGVFANIYTDKKTVNKIETLENIIFKEIDNIEETETIQNTTEKENKSTTTIEDLTHEEEEALEEQEIEDEAFELQGNIAYEGDRAKSWGIELRKLCRTYIL